MLLYQSNSQCGYEVEDTCLITIIGNTREDGDKDVLRKHHHGTLGKVEKHLHPGESSELDHFV